MRFCGCFPQLFLSLPHWNTHTHTHTHTHKHRATQNKINFEFYLTHAPHMQVYTCTLILHNDTHAIYLMTKLIHSANRKSRDTYQNVQSPLCTANEMVWTSRPWNLLYTRLFGAIWHMRCPWGFSTTTCLWPCIPISLSFSLDHHQVSLDQPLLAFAQQRSSQCLFIPAHIPAISIFFYSWRMEKGVWLDRPWIRKFPWCASGTYA